MIKFNREYKQYTMSPISAAFLVLFVTFFLYQFVGGLFTLQFVGLEVTKENAGLVRLFTSISQIVFMFFLTILFAKAIYNDFTNTFRVRKIYSVELLFSILGLVLIIMASQIFLYIQSYYINLVKQNYPALKTVFDAIEKLSEMVEKTYSNILYMDNFWDYLSIVISVALVPAFCEEFLFRGFVQSSFEKRWSITLTIIITALLFALFHFNPFAIVPLFALGAYFSYLVYLTDSIFYSVILHFLNNFFTITIFAVYRTEDVISAKPEINYPLSSLYFGLILLVFLFGFTMVLLKKQVDKRKLQFKENENENMP
ncbi:MAG: CPBP family intramembrane metalloprotease [Ignavibacteria bacterium]|nr:CPBP family intramembrane metalloprotease [Ignavibacteria bacterium]MDH7526651.1 CPBP family intramembrane metalloprotease [Ignavibacteria bacterium]